MKIIIAATYRYFSILSIISLILFFSKCISPYEPDIQGSKGLLVVDGSIIKGNKIQVVMISRTSPISLPGYLPVENCHVSVLDDTGNEFVFYEESPGKYVANIDDVILEYDKQYKLVFTTPSGDNYESNYQGLLETSSVDSLYGITEYHYSSKTGEESIKGVQFYVDLEAPEDASRYYRWVLEETWERHAKNLIWAEYDGYTIKRFNRQDSLFRCWVTKDVTGLYAASTVNLSANHIKKIPMHFIENSSYKMNYKYAALVRQYALNEDAYEYWHQKQIELNESGNIYTSQPSQPKSNVRNTGNPDELVLGFFWAASFTEKSLVLKNLSEPIDEDISCGSIGIFNESHDFDEIAASIYSAIAAPIEPLPELPIYISLQYNTNYNIVLTPACVDCRILGGNIKKPDFWE